jgi:hypothetical protein
MTYKFPLVPFYRAGYNDDAVTFRPPRSSDCYYISQWLAEAVGGSKTWQRRMRKLLQEEFRHTAKLSQRMSWMATTGKRRLFFLEIIETGTHHTVEAYLSAPLSSLDHPASALAIWEWAVVHLGRQALYDELHVQLSSLRPAERHALEHLAAHYSLFFT